MASPSYTEILADFVLGLRYEDLSEKTIRLAKFCLMDNFACTIAGVPTPESQIIQRFVEETASPPEATLIGSWGKSSALYSALANGYNCHILEYDDGIKGGGIHSGATVLPAAIATAQKVGASGKELITAIVAGCEAGGRVGAAAGDSHYKYWHSTATCATFGAAAAAGKLLGLTREQMVWALGSAGTQAAGLWEFAEDKTMSKYLHCGKAAFNGILSALLAQKGLTGARRIVEGPRGFLTACSEREEDAEAIFAATGDDLMLDKICFKFFPCCGHTHSAVTAALRLREEQGLQPEAISEVRVTTYETAVQIAKNNSEFAEPRAAKFSIVACVAAALYWGRVDEWVFEPERLADAGFLAFAKKVTIAVDDAYSRDYPVHWTARVEVDTDRGIFDKLALCAKGDAGDPPTRRDMVEKFHLLTSSILTKETAELLINRCEHLDEMPNMTLLFDGVAG